MKKTKILTVLVCAVLSFALVACNNSSGGSSDDEKPAKPSKSDTDDEEDDFTWPDFPKGAYTVLPANTTGSAGTSATYVTFGLYPQTKKSDNITVTSSSKNLNGWTVYAGSDNEWYVKHGESGNEKYFKVEPIKWRVLTTDYNGTGKKLLLAENILINKAYDDDSNSYADSTIRNYLTGDFLTTAFTQAEQAAIATTTVVNNARSTNPDGSAEEWNSGANDCASDTPTEDKIFLLSEQEVTKADYGFAAAYDECKGDGTHDDSTRIRMTTAFAEANGADQTTAGYGGYWWLRSPYYDGSYDARVVDDDGFANDYFSVDYGNNGVVPALCLN